MQRRLGKEGTCGGVRGVDEVAAAGRVRRAMTDGVEWGEDGRATSSASNGGRREGQQGGGCRC